MRLLDSAISISNFRRVVMTRKYPRHIHYHQGIVDNLRARPELNKEAIPDDDLLYWMFDLWATSADHPDESLIIEWKDTAVIEIRMKLDTLARNHSIDREDINKLNLLALRQWE